MMLLLLVLFFILGYVNCFMTNRYVSNGIRKIDNNNNNGKLLMVSTSSLTIPPTQFMDCTKRAAIATGKLIASGSRLIEVEFPPLPLEYLEDSSSSARSIAEANTRWGIEFAKGFSLNGKISIIYPDQEELEDAMIFVKKIYGDDFFKQNQNVTLGTIRTDSLKNAASLDKIIGSIFGATFAGEVAGIEDTKLYVALVSSTQELPDLEKLHDLDPTVPIVFFNLKLDQLRGDLGLPLFPGRDLHYRFLSKIKPSFLMRSRSFATSLRRPPFIINYSGLLYRNYPEPYQCILNTGDGKSKLSQTLEERPTNKDFRDALTASLIVPGVPKEELQTKGELVWWEKDMVNINITINYLTNLNYHYHYY